MIVRILDGSRRLPDESTVFQAELMTMSDLVDILLRDSDRYIKIFFDSRTAIQALNGT